jgi:hypothetical protein
MADDITKLNVTSAMSSAASDLASSDAAGTDADPFGETKNELVTRFELLPEDVRKAIMDDGYQKKLFDLAKAEKLTYEELGIIETETTMVLLGMTKPADYRSELESELKKTGPEIDTIVKAVNDQIFAPIRASLERIYSAKKEPADYIPQSIVTGVTPKPAEPIFEPTTAPANAIYSTIGEGSRATTPSLTNADKSVLEKTGVVLTPTPAATPFVPASEIGNRANLLASIENPSKIPPSIVAAKLNIAGAVITPTKSTDYSVPKTPPVAPGTASPSIHSDPYREPIG